MKGGESASSWLCLRSHDLTWSAHARIVQAGILEEGIFFRVKKKKKTGKNPDPILEDLLL